MTTFADIPISIHPSEQPLFIQLFESMRDAITDGRVSPGATLPSTRDLAAKLGVSRHTIMKAVKLLVTQGYIDSSENKLQVFQRSTQQLTGDAHQLRLSGEFLSLPEHTVSRFAQNLLSNQEISFADFERGTISDQRFALNCWYRLISQEAKRAPLDPAKPNFLGERRVREEVCNYLNRFRSLRCCADNTVIFSNRKEALDFTCKLMLDGQDKIIVENPGSAQTRTLFEAYGAEIAGIDVDEDGMRVENLGHESAKFIYLTPAHHLPTGATLSLERRRHLLEWAKQTTTFIVEDGFDSEYWHKGRPYPPLQGLDEADSVIYLASFERLLFPASTITFVIFPCRLMPAAAALKEAIGTQVNPIEQMVLCQFLQRGLVERHLRSSQRLLSNRRQQLVISLMKALGQRVNISKESSGTHLLIRLNGYPEELIEQAAKQAGFPLISTDSYYMRAAIQNEYLLSFATIGDQTLMQAADIFVQILQKLEAETVTSSDFSVATESLELTPLQFDDFGTSVAADDSRLIGSSSILTKS